MKKIILLLSILFTFSAYGDQIFKPLTDEQIAIVKKTVGAKLLDDESARYKLGDFLATDEKQQGFYCGFVNAKNRFNAYTGYQPFMIFFLINPKTSEYTAVVLTIASDEAGRNGLFETCKDKGYKLN